MSGRRARGAMRAVVALAGVLIVSLVAPSQAAATGHSRLDWTPCFTDVGPFECATAHGAARLRPARAAPRSRSRSRACRRPTRGGGSARCSSTRAAPAARGSTSWSVPARSSTRTRSARASTSSASIRAASCAARRCSASTARRSGGRGSPRSPFPITREEERIWIEADRFLTSACERRAGPIIDHMSTANVARDLDVLRAAVGDRQAHLRRLLVRLLPRQHLREPVPRPRAGRRPRRRARPDRVVDGAQPVEGAHGAVLDAAAQRRRRAGDAERVLPALRRGRRPVRVLRRRGAALRRARTAPAARAGRDHVPGRLDRAARLLAPDRSDAGRDVRLVLLAGLRAAARRHRGGGGRAGDAGRPARALRPATRLPGRGLLPELPRGLPGRRLLGQRQPRPLRRVVDQRRAGGRQVRLLRPHLDVGLEHLRGVARLRPRPLHGPVHPQHGQSRARRRQPLRPGHALSGRASSSTSFCRDRRCCPCTAGATSRCSSPSAPTRPCRATCSLVATPPRGATCEQDVVPFTQSEAATTPLDSFAEPSGAVRAASRLR